MENAPKLRFEGFDGEWEKKTLGDISVFFDTMRKPLEGSKRVAGPYPYYGASGIVDYVDGYIFEEELVLLSEDGANILDRNYPVCFLATGKYWVNNHAHVLKAKEGNDNNFICNSLERKDYKEFNTGMAMPKLNKDVCQGIPVCCPCYEEQRLIGNILRNIDHLITLHQRKHDTLLKAKQFYLQNLFPKKGEKVPAIRFAGFEGEWRWKKLGDVFQEYSEKNHPELPPLTIIQGGGTVLREKSDRCLQYDKDSLNGYKVVHKDDFIVHLRSFEGGLEIANSDGIVSPAYHVLHGEGIEPRFYYPYFRSRQFIDRQLTGFVYGIRDGRSIDIEGMKTIKIPYPSFEEQREISSFLNEIDHLLALQSRKLETLKKMKQFMLQNLFV